VVVTNPRDNFVAPEAGAAYLFDGRTGALLGDLVGGSAQDRVGAGGPEKSTDSGVPPVDREGGGKAAPRGDGSAGIGSPDPGGAPQSLVSNFGVAALRNGNYVVQSANWNGNRGAATWGDGTVGVSGVVDPSNSLVGSNPDDQVSYFGVAALSNGNYVVSSPYWNSGRGAATWGDGTAGVRGPVDDGNSLVGSNPQDSVGNGGITALSNGNYVVSSSYWNAQRGAATWGDGTAGVRGPVDATNSLVGSMPGDQVSFYNFTFPGVAALPNGNYVVRSPQWNGRRGAATWGDGTAGVTGPVDATNSLVGSHPDDGVGSYSVVALANGSYVVTSPSWNGERGAATWGDGTAGVTGPVDATNSLVGSHPGDGVGYDLAALANGNYVVRSPQWNGGRGAATWADGTAGVTGAVDASNSLVG
jgi:hypothetical protein